MATATTSSSRRSRAGARASARFRVGVRARVSAVSGYGHADVIVSQASLRVSTVSGYGHADVIVSQASLVGCWGMDEEWWGSGLRGWHTGGAGLEREVRRQAGSLAHL